MKSASDNIEYPEFCLQASQDEEIFKTFRQNEIYRSILEHFSYEDGLKSIRQVADENPDLLNMMDIFKSNDDFGGAQVFEYEGIGKISPSTLQYVRQLSYLETYFGDLTGKHIVEIGGGYGGLAKLVMDRFNIASYTIYDLPQVNKLSRKYLEKFNANYLDKLHFGDLEDSKTQQYDLCISNCAFTECTPPIQDLYLNKVIGNSSRGFMLYNFRVESYHPVILLSKLESLGLKHIGSNEVKDATSNVFIVAWNTDVKLLPLPYKRRYIYKVSPILYHAGLKIFRLLKP